MKRRFIAGIVVLTYSGFLLADEGGLSVSKLSKLGLGDLQVREGKLPDEAGVNPADAEPATKAAELPTAAEWTGGAASPSTLPPLLPHVRRDIEPQLSQPALAPIVPEIAPVRAITKENIAGENVTREDVREEPLEIDQPVAPPDNTDRLLELEAEVMQRTRSLEQAQAAARRAVARVAAAQAALDKARAEQAAAE